MLLLSAGLRTVPSLGIEPRRTHQGRAPEVCFNTPLAGVPGSALPGEDAPDHGRGDDPSDEAEIEHETQKGHERGPNLGPEGHEEDDDWQKPSTALGRKIDVTHSVSLPSPEYWRPLRRAFSG